MTAPSTSPQCGSIIGRSTSHGSRWSRSLSMTRHRRTWRPRRVQRRLKARHHLSLPRARLHNKQNRFLPRQVQERTPRQMPPPRTRISKVPTRTNRSRPWHRSPHCLPWPRQHAGHPGNHRSRVCPPFSSGSVEPGTRLGGYGGESVPTIPGGHTGTSRALQLLELPPSRPWCWRAWQ